MLGVILLPVTCMFMLTGASICPKQTQTDVPNFTQELGVEDMVRFGSSIAILCCSQGYDNITWYRKEASEWMPYPPQSDGKYDVPTLEENQQILRIIKANMGDSTEFRCDLIKTGTIVKQHVTDIVVQRCDDIARGPMVVYPYPQNVTIDHYGGNVTLYCTGYFGCGDSELRIVYWKVDGKRIVNDKRYVTQKYNRNDNTSVGQTLTIYNIQAEDIKRSYTCNLRSPQVYFGSTTIPVTIAINQRTPIKMIIGVTVGGVIAFVLITVVIGLVVRHFYGPRVTLFIRSRLPRLKPAQERGDTLRYNALLYHAPEDNRKANEIKEQLVEKGYDIFISDEMGGNQSLSVYEKKVQESMMVLFLYTENLREDNFAHFLLQSLINYKDFHNIIFLVMDTFVPKTVMECTASAVNPETRRAYGNQEDAENNVLETDAAVGNDSITENPTFIENTANGSKDLSFWKTLPKCNVPTENASKRQKINFQCWLQNNIPKFRDQLVKTKSNRNKSMSSDCPLLAASPNEDGLGPPNLSRISSDDEVFVHALPSDRDFVNLVENGDVEEVRIEVEGRPTPNLVEPLGSQNEKSSFKDSFDAVGTPYLGDDDHEYLASGSSDRGSPMSVTFNHDSNEGNQLSGGSTSLGDEAHEYLASGSSGIGSPMSGNFNLVSNDDNKNGINTSQSIRIQGTPINNHNSVIIEKDDGRESELNSFGNGTSSTPRKLSTRQSSGESGYGTPHHSDARVSTEFEM